MEADIGNNVVSDDIVRAMCAECACRTLHRQNPVEPAQNCVQRVHFGAGHDRRQPLGQPQLSESVGEGARLILAPHPENMVSYEILAAADIF